MAQPKKKHYPYAGQLYLAQTPGLKALGRFKFGRTQREVQRRANEHAGVLSLERSLAIFSLVSLDAVSAENLAHALFDELNYKIRGRKELVVCSYEQAQDVLRQAVAQAEIRHVEIVSAPSESEAPRPYCSDERIASLLDMPWTLGADTAPLYAWLRLSLKSRSIGQRLARVGILCVNWSASAPVYRFENSVFQRAKAWLAGQGDFGPFPAYIEADVKW